MYVYQITDSEPPTATRLCMFSYIFLANGLMLWMHVLDDFRRQQFVSLYDLFGFLQQRGGTDSMKHKFHIP